MASKSYAVKECCQPRDQPPCENEARYTTSDGSRVCAIHGVGLLSLRDSDVGAAISLLDEILRANERPEHSPLTRDQLELGRGMIGRFRR